MTIDPQHFNGIISGTISVATGKKSEGASQTSQKKGEGASQTSQPDADKKLSTLEPNTFESGLFVAFHTGSL